MTRPLTAALLLLLAGLCSYTAALNDPTDNVLPVDPACVFGLLNSVKSVGTHTHTHSRAAFVPVAA